MFKLRRKLKFLWRVHQQNQVYWVEHFPDSYERTQRSGRHKIKSIKRKLQKGNTISVFHLSEDNITYLTSQGYKVAEWMPDTYYIRTITPK